MQDINITEDSKLIPKLNEYQTPITDELLQALPDEVQQQFLSDINNIPFIANLISDKRQNISELPRDAKGRAIIDLSNPPIITDTDYFRPAALYYLKNGCYTKLKPNSNPNSEFRKHWDEEIRRCYDGYIRQSDGAYVTGYEYFFLNYMPIMVNFIVKGTKRAIRKENFPWFFEGIHWRFIYLQKAIDEGHHAIELARRGCGKSIGLASIMAHNLILGKTQEQHRRCITLLLAATKEYLSDSKDGTLAKFRPMLSFLAQNTPFPHLMLKNSPNEMTWQMGYKDEEGNEKGTLNQVIAVSIKDDPGKARGKRACILYEEMGNFAHLLELYDINRRSVEDGGYAFDLMYLVGTASENESDFSSAKTLLYSPEGYNILSISNVYDRPKQGRQHFGYFFPAYVNRAGCYNKDGVSDIVKALLEVYQARYKAKYSADPNSVLRVIAEDPITPAEAIIKVKSAFFPVTQLTERLQEIDSDVHAFDDVYVGDLIINKQGTVEFKPTGDLPIHDYPVKNDTPGAIEIFNMPEKNKSGKIPAGRYILGTDPVDNDTAESSSLYSTFVLDLWTDKIVAEFTGRKQFANDNFEITRKLCQFYNGKCLYESNKKGLFAYFKQKNSLQYLAETPDYLRDKQLIKYSSFGSNNYGVNASAALNNYQNGLLRDWLLKEVNVVQKGDDDIEREVKVPNLFFIRNRAFLEELIAFNPEINVDRIHAMGMVMLYREEFMILYQGNIQSKQEAPKNYLGNDDFFSRNYDQKFGSKFKVNTESNLNYE